VNKIGYPIVLAAVCLMVSAHAEDLATIMKTCNAEASGAQMTGDVRKAYVADCIKVQHVPPSPKPGKAGDVIPPMKGVAEAAKKAVIKNLKDPYSAHVEIKAIEGSQVCGTLNAKNSYGAYTGERRFLYNGEKDTVIQITEAFDDPILRDPIGVTFSKICDDMEREYAANHGVMRRRFNPGE
jgi:hypothetical protein